MRNQRVVAVYEQSAILYYTCKSNVHVRTRTIFVYLLLFIGAFYVEFSVVTIMLLFFTFLLNSDSSFEDVFSEPYFDFVKNAYLDFSVENILTLVWGYLS